MFYAEDSMRSMLRKVGSEQLDHELLKGRVEAATGMDLHGWEMVGCLLAEQDEDLVGGLVLDGNHYPEIVFVVSFLGR